MSENISVEVAELGALIALVRAMYPHADFPAGPYDRAARSIAEDIAADARTRAQLTQGLAELRAKEFQSMSPDDQLAHLRSISGSAFFQGVRARVITTLYNDPEVWALLGWEGESFSKGGYLDRGFADLDWLPAARIEEASA